MNKPSVANVKVVKVNTDSHQLLPDLVSVEEPLEIRLGHGTEDDRVKKPISITMRTPGNDFELALGFLFTEGIIQSANETKEVRYCTEPETNEAAGNVVIIELQEHVTVDFQKLERHFYTTSSCGVCGKASIEAIQNANCPIIPKSPNLVNESLIHNLPKRLREKQAVFEYTGGLHGCALFDFNGALLISREDVGRHNALDKLIGAVIAEGEIPPENTILLLSGRVSFELVQKAAMAGIPIIAAVGAPSSLAVQSATELGITLIGFLRDDRFNIYCHPERITL